MGVIKKLSGQTAYYGLSSVVGRLLNYLLVPLYTYVITDPSRMGIVTYLYAVAALMNVFLSYGMETAYFRYSNASDTDAKKVGNTAYTSLFITTTVFAVAAAVCHEEIARWMDYEDMSLCVLYFIVIVAADAYAVIPFARLRQEGRAKTYALIRIAGIVTGIVLNVVLVYLLPRYGVMQVDVKNIFLSNVVSSIMVLILLFFCVRGFRLEIDRRLWVRMLKYGWPILLAGTAGIVNETMDRVFLRELLPEESREYWLGVYGNCFKMGIFIALFTQAFRMAGEPFFFSRAKDSDARQIYARVTLYYTMVIGAMYVGVMGNMSWLQYFVGEEYRTGMDIVPIILLANICLGLYYNLSMWYKLTDRTIWGAYLSVIGAVVTVAVIFYGVPRWGYMAAAIAHLATYGTMMILSYALGQKYYAIPYAVGNIMSYLALAVVLGYVSWYVLDGNVWAGNAFFLLYCTVVALSRKKELKSLAHEKKRA